MRYEVFFLLQQYQQKYPDRFHILKSQDLKDKYIELKTEDVNVEISDSDFIRHGTFSD